MPLPPGAARGRWLWLRSGDRPAHGRGRSTVGLSLRRLVDTNKDNPDRQVRLSFLGQRGHCETVGGFPAVPIGATPGAGSHRAPGGSSALGLSGMARGMSRNTGGAAGPCRAAALPSRHLPGPASRLGRRRPAPLRLRPGSRGVRRPADVPAHGVPRGGAGRSGERTAPAWGADAGLAAPYRVMGGERGVQPPYASPHSHSGGGTRSPRSRRVRSTSSSSKRRSGSSRSSPHSSRSCLSR